MQGKSSSGNPTVRALLQRESDRQGCLTAGIRPLGHSYSGNLIFSGTGLLSLSSDFEMQGLELEPI